MPLDPAVIMPIVRRTANSVSKNFPSYVTAADTESVLYIWIYSKKSWIEQQMEDASWEAGISRILRKVAFDHCNAERAAAEGYSPDDLFKYSIPKIKTLLPDAFDYESWQSFGLHGDGQPGARPQANQTGDRIAELIDVKNAVSKLNDDAYNVLVWNFKLHWTHAMVGSALEISEDAARKRSERAVAAVQTTLGRREPDENRGPQKRVVRSNAASRAAVSTQYDG